MLLKTIALLFTLALLATPLPAEAQKVEKVYRIAIFAARHSEFFEVGNPWHEGVLTPLSFAITCGERTGASRISVKRGLCHGLRELGYVDRTEGGNVELFYVFDENLERLLDAPDPLVRSKVDVILTLGPRAALAAKRATTTIPIVFVGIPDPVAIGLVTSLGRPGGNITGLTNMSVELSGKRLQLLKEVVPNASRVAVLWKATNTALQALREMQVAAQALGVNLQSLEVRDPDDLRAAFSAMTQARADALIVIPDHTLWILRNWIVDLAIQNQLPAMFWRKDFVHAGALMAYGPSLPHLGRRTAALVDKVLKGAKPADLPVEQPIKFDFVINLKTAKALGLTIPPSVLVRADRVIE